MEAAHRRLRNGCRAHRPYGHRRHARRGLQRRAERRHPQDRGRAHRAAAGEAPLPLDGSADRSVRAPLPLARRRRSRFDSREIRTRLSRDPAHETAAAAGHPRLRRAVRASDLMERLPVLPLGQLVVYPHVVLPLALTDPKAVQLIDEVIQGEKWLMANGEPLIENLLEDSRTEALKRTVIAQFSRVIDIAPYLGAELHEVLAGITEAGKLADFIAANLDLALPAKAELLAIDDVTRRLERLSEFMVQELQVLEVGTQIQEKVKNRLDQNQREYVLREQLQVIRQELGEGEGDDELDELAKRLEEAQLPAEARKVAERELKRLRQMSPQSAEYQVARTYLDVFATLPWSRVTQDRLDLKAAREILDRDHYDLKTIKERILEYLAVRTLNPEAKGSILCFVGPPGRES